MTPAELPHFALPLRFDGHAVVVEQDSFDDVAMCVEAAARTERGTRLELPEFGVPDQLFVGGELDAEELRSALVESEPRAEAFADRIEDPAAARVETIRILLEEEA